ncbi:MAG: NADPH-dependent aldehyde reductase Ahr [Microcystaceae cyanobacterium]
MIRAYAATEAGGQLKPFEYDPGPLGDEIVEIKVEYCGICHSDLSMLNNDWGFTQYPFVPGHEVVGTVAAVGDRVKTIKVGDRVGAGWFSHSCMTCEWCLSGNQNLCPTAESIIVGRHGGFADKVRVNYEWATPIPDGLRSETIGPLFCGGITVFNPLIICGVKPTDKVGVIGVGGLGHMAIAFLNAWGCEVTAFSHSPEKEAEVKAMGAKHFVNSRDPEALKSVANSLDFILSTVNVELDWMSYLLALRPQGRLHLVGVVNKPLSISAFPLALGQKTISGSPLGNPITTRQMLDFSLHHNLEPIVEVYPIEQINEAFDKLQNGKPRYRLVVKL